MTWSVACVLFMLVGLVQMIEWALAKQRNYLREFKDYPRQRKAILPYLI
jgi:very-long-chain enoyl-CoA reductase